MYVFMYLVIHRKFSLTRLNLHIALLAADQSGCIIVDSTRRGKQYPDSFNATVPLWCGVINTILFGTASGRPPSSQHSTCDVNSEVNTRNAKSSKGKPLCQSNFVGPPWMPASQHASIQAVITETVSSLPGYVLTHIRNMLSSKLRKPLQPLWVAVVDEMLDIQGEEASCENILSSPSDCDFIPVVLLSVSEDRSESQHREEGFSWFYVKGAGDDQENWCRGLQPSVFWMLEENILSLDDPDSVDEAVDKIVAANCENMKLLDDNNVASDDLVSFGDTMICNNTSHRPVAVVDMLSNYDALIVVDTTLDGPSSVPLDEHAANIHRIHIGSSTKKKSDQELWQDYIASCLQFYIKIVKKKRESTTDNSLPKILIHSSSTACDDAQGGITVALLLCFFEIDFKYMLNSRKFSQRSISKVDVQVWCGLVQSMIPKAVMSRTMMKELNKFFVVGSVVVRNDDDKGSGELDTSLTLLTGNQSRLMTVYKLYQGLDVH